MLSRIIVPLDGAAVSEAAVPRAVEIARRTGATLTLLHVVRRPVRADASLMEIATEQGRLEGERYLERVARDVRASGRIDIRTTMLEGPVATAICTDAGSDHTTLIVMTTHGQSGWHRTWIGSIADTVVRRARVPVMLVRVGPRPRSAATGRDLRVLVALDGTPCSDEILAPLREGAFGSQAVYRLLTVVAPVASLHSVGTLGYPVLDYDDEATALAVRGARAHLLAVADQLWSNEPGIAIECDVIVGDNPARAVVDAAAMADVVAMATHGHTVSRVLLGSVTDKVLRGSACDLLLCHPFAGRNAPKRDRRTLTGNLSAEQEGSPDCWPPIERRA